MSRLPTTVADACYLALSRVPARDSYGHMIHPDLRQLVAPDTSVPEQQEPVSAVLRGMGYEPFVRLMTDDQLLRFAEQDSPDCSWWKPEPPDKTHWTLVLLVDSEDGPMAVYTRPYNLSPCPPMVSWGVFDRPLDYPDGCIARAFHGDQATSLSVRGAALADVIAQLPDDLAYMHSLPGDPPFLVCTAIGARTAAQSVRG